MKNGYSLHKRLNPLDELFLAFFGVSLLVPEIGGSFGIEKRLLWIPSLVFFFWTLYIGICRARITFADSLERSFVERVLGWAYGVTLVITLVFNGLSNSLVSNVDVVTLIVIGAVTVATVVILMSISLAFLVRLFFGDQWSLLTVDQRDGLVNVLKELGGASIFFSVAIITFQNAAFAGELTTLLIVYFPFMFFLIRIRSLERRSRTLADELADSLSKSNWQRRLESLKKRRQNRRKR